MLGLRLSDALAEDAAAGWDGGLYRAWTDGDRVAVVLKTVWDTRADAQAFADALADWLDGEHALVNAPAGRTVQAAFATDEGTLRELVDVLG
jgi:hypothetical protein